MMWAYFALAVVFMSGVALGVACRIASLEAKLELYKRQLCASELTAMAKATLTFDDTEGYEFRAAVNGTKLMCVLWDLDQEMRSCLKYNAPPCIEETDESEILYNSVIGVATQHWRDRLWALCRDDGIDLDDC